ncbi:dihydrofolate reductase [Legionella waltersii]|uniref:Dihydrofolate reductase n=1 Tax=Legionella waltersii TaxID=66969 RepID=A0A0W1AE20_9GAMM|nr:dihydrofolate reductase [Legionella waltersii]KTD79395.1 dihydrofolate reductase FolA [Legionella waltersii]SNU97895.1 dihydrofolate reductase [Legionella waltersii]
MPIISLIAALDEAGGIGLNNQLLCHLPADLQYFKSTTMGKPIIMGRKTFESIGKPLPGRENIILSTTLNKISGALVIDSLDKALVCLQDAPEIMIIGGEKIYKQAITFANRLYITKIHHLFNADAFFPKIREDEWHCLRSEFRQHDEKNKYDLTFMLYEHSDKNSI